MADNQFDSNVSGHTIISAMVVALWSFEYNNPWTVSELHAFGYLLRHSPEVRFSLGFKSAQFWPSQKFSAQTWDRLSGSLRSFRSEPDFTFCRISPYDKLLLLKATIASPRVRIFAFFFAFRPFSVFDLLRLLALALGAQVFLSSILLVSFFGIISMFEDRHLSSGLFSLVKGRSYYGSVSLGPPARLPVCLSACQTRNTRKRLKVFSRNLVRWL